ncbi:hypothetical protein [Stenotrophomonas sp. SAU14A_NAIMI4_5]|uniref:hypothetical protein n=1 Tax=Stenotrophomonas sp. SAU14A_NAIMI4_5 TaxID=2072413 RepID=UPI00131F2EE7|nr:hypothetical protein [Stenotrophomonas sp. SAU14A_NAIMI4_5]
MTPTTARLRRFFGAGLMLFLLHVLALASVALAVGYFHHRLDLLLEPIEVPLLLSCGGGDPMARMQVAEHLLARAGALDDWQPVCWVVVSALLCALLGTVVVSLHWLQQVQDLHRRSVWGLLGLHLLASALAVLLLGLYEQVWRGLVNVLPTVCMAEPTVQEATAMLPAYRTLPQMLSDAGLLVPQVPDALAIVLCGVLLAATVIGVWLWRALPMPAPE